MIGRFRVHAGKNKNLPAATFGNISMMPDEPLYNPSMSSRSNQESFLVEMRSVTGFSGSPVFLYLPPNNPRGKDKANVPYGEYHWRFIGICWGHINADVKGYDSLHNEYRIKIDSAMAAVVPAWKLLDILDGEEMQKIKQKVKV